METGNPRPCPANSGGRGGTEHREAGAKNIGMLVFKGIFSFINTVNILVNMGFNNNPCLRADTLRQALYHFPITQFSRRSHRLLWRSRLFHHSSVPLFSRIMG